MREHVRQSFIRTAVSAGLAGVALVIQASFAAGEIYQGIRPFSTLGDLKTRFPKAEFEERHPAWAQAEDVLYRITGAGLVGSLLVKFDDRRAQWEMLATTTSDSAMVEEYAALALQPDDSMTVGWVRWVPDSPVPITRLVAKYGTGYTDDYSDESLEPYRKWKLRGITAYLTDDKQFVNRIDFDFTTTDYSAALKQKYGIESPRTPRASVKRSREKAK